MNYKQRRVINCGNSIQAMGDFFFLNIIMKQNQLHTHCHWFYSYGNTVLIILRMVGHTCYTIGVLILFSNEGKHLQKQFHKTILIH
jgi:hypothetical protein